MNDIDIDALIAFPDCDDPRISTRTPGWLPAGTDWGTAAVAYEHADVEWIGRQWELAGGQPPRSGKPPPDTSWITRVDEEEARAWSWVLVIVGVGLSIALAFNVAWMVLAG